MIRALIVDDEPAAAGIIRYFINMSHLPIEIVGEARDGAAALGLLERQNPALVFLDIQMPNMNGYQAAEAIRKMADPAKAGTPIVAMTANAFEEDKQNAYAAGMDAHLAKPINIELLCLTLTKLMSERDCARDPKPTKGE